MEIQQKFGHFGEVQLTDIDGVGVLILRKAPLKYYDKDLPEDNKDKADVVFLCEDGVWQFLDAIGHNPERPDYDRIAEMVRDERMK